MEIWSFCHVKTTFPNRATPCYSKTSYEDFSGRLKKKDFEKKLEDTHQDDLLKLWIAFEAKWRRGIFYHLPYLSEWIRKKKRDSI